MASINIIGKVIDTVTREGLVGVNVKILQNNSNTGLGFATGLEGNINSNINLEVGTYVFEFSFIGYTSKTRTRKITPTTKQINLNITELEESDTLLNTFEAVSPPNLSISGSVIDKNTNTFLSEATILSSDPKGESKSQTNGKFTISLNIKDSNIITKPKEVKEDTSINTVVVGGVSWATAQYMQKQWELAGLSTDRVEFINYNEKQKFQDTITQPAVRNIMGFSGGGNLIWPEVNKDFDFIGLIDPSAPKVIKSIPGLPSNVKLVSNSNNWIGNKGTTKSFLYNNLLSMERNGVSNKWGTRHKQMPLKFFQTYKDLFIAKPEENKEVITTYKNFNILLAKEGYNQVEVPAVNGDGTLKKDLGKIKLVPIKQDVKEEIIKNKQITEVQKEILNEDTPKDFTSSVLKKVFQTIQDRLIPIILQQIAAFGISKFNEEVIKNISSLPKTCPPNIDALNIVIAKKNKLTKQLNNLYKSINSINKFLNIPEMTIEISEKAVVAAKIGYNVQAFIPSTVATPNPVGPILLVKDLIDKLEDLISILNKKIGTGTIQLRLIIEELKKVLTLLNILDALIQSCAEEIGGTAEQQTQVSNELLNSTQQQSNQLSPVVTNVNGFEMAVITVDNVTINGLKRRRAIARNKSGVIMLQGEPSFSSNDQILIDELVFYIQQNDLKAD